MPILNSVYKGQKLFVSEFFCPNCFAVRAYNIKPMSKDLDFRVIPFLESNEAHHVIECQSCKKAFDPEILKRQIQTLLKLARAAKHELLNSKSPGSLKLKLMSDGLKEEFIDTLILLAQS